MVGACRRPIGADTSRQTATRACDPGPRPTRLVRMAPLKRRHFGIAHWVECAWDTPEPLKGRTLEDATSAHSGTLSQRKSVLRSRPESRRNRRGGNRRGYSGEEGAGMALARRVDLPVEGLSVRGPLEGAVWREEFLPFAQESRGDNRRELRRDESQVRGRSVKRPVRRPNRTTPITRGRPRTARLPIPQTHNPTHSLTRCMAGPSAFQCPPRSTAMLRSPRAPSTAGPLRHQPPHRSDVRRDSHARCSDQTGETSTSPPNRRTYAYDSSHPVKRSSPSSLNQHSHMHSRSLSET
jgi:hypothetical protein